MEMTMRNGIHGRSSHAKRAERTTKQPVLVTRKSVVTIYFVEKHMTLPYYNDRFDLKRGDLVYVDGKLEGVRGRVTEVNYHFKIKLSDYKRVIAVADTEVHGQFFMAGSHFVTFNRRVLPKRKVVTWFQAPAEREEFAIGGDDNVFRLDDPYGLNVTSPIAQRGHRYYVDNRVKYICIDGGKGYAIVEGSTAYEVEFEYMDGEIKNLYCTCFCSYHCKHEVATILQLRETLDLIGKHYREEYERTKYFAAVAKGTLFGFAIDSKEDGNFIL